VPEAELAHKSARPAAWLLMANTLIAIQARYHTPLQDLLKHNRIFGFQMFLFCLATLYLYAWLVSR
jgi:hypothetical protein